MTKKIKKFIDKGMKGSIKKQSELFNQNFLTKMLLKSAIKRGKNGSY